MRRRTFLRNSALAMGALALPSSGGAQPSSAMPQSTPARRMLVGTPILPEVLYEQGLAETLDHLQEWAGVNTVMVFTHRHVARQYQPGFAPLTDPAGAPLTDLYVRTDPGRYDNPAWARRDPAAKYADRDILDDLRGPAEARGLALYARILEPYRLTGVIPGLEGFAEVDAEGQPRNQVCLNHPGYIRYWAAVAEDLLLEHPYLQGFKFGQERPGPLHHALRGETSTCFCPHCRALAADRGVDPEEARRGYLALRDFTRQVRAAGRPRDGHFVTWWRTLARYPAVLSWERFWFDSKENQRRRLYRQIKGLAPHCQVGWHIDHGMTWDPFTRAFEDFTDKVDHSDWLSLALYFDSMGRRSTGHYEALYRDLLLADAVPGVSYPLYLGLIGLSPEEEPPYQAHGERDTAFSAEYVHRECRRVVEAVAGRVQVHARIGFDMPGYACAVTPGQVRQAVTRALDAGVDGLWCGREWNELRPENARAFGEAWRSHPAAARAAK